MFEPAEIPSDSKDESGKAWRTCGCCMQSKELATEFYKDGHDSEGNPKYRRDCKECYRVTRLRSRRAKRPPVVPPSKRGKKR